MSSFNEVKMPRYDEGNIAGTVRELYTAFRALAEQLTIAMQNIDEDNGAASSDHLNQLEQTVNNKLSDINGNYSSVMQSVDALRQEVSAVSNTASSAASAANEAAQKVAAFTVTADAVKIDVSDGEGNASSLILTPNGITADTQNLMVNNGQVTMMQDSNSVGSLRVDTTNNNAVQLFSNGVPLGVYAGTNNLAMTASKVYVITDSGTTTH